MNFEATINAVTLKEYVTSLLAIIDADGRLKVTEEGIVSKNVDVANVAMVSSELSSSDAFEEFHVEPDESGKFEIGVDFKRIKDMLAVASGSDSVVKLKTHGGRLQMNVGNLSYTLSLLDLDSLSKEPKVPELDYPLEIELSVDKFKHAIRAADKVADMVLVGVKDSKEFYISAEGEMDTLRFGLSKGDFTFSMMPEKGVHPDIHTLFSIDYLLSMSKSVGSAETVRLGIGTDYPLRMSFSIADGAGKISYLLAPRIG